MHKKTCRMSENVLFGGGGCRGSEKLLNFHHLQIMKNIKGAGASELHFITSNLPIFHSLVFHSFIRGGGVR